MIIMRCAMLAYHNPLSPPDDPQLLTAYLRHFSLIGQSPRPRLLHDLARVFAMLPYENLTKIVRKDVEGPPDRARRRPEVVIRDHISWGTGGTCFALSATLLHLVRAIGYEAQVILADRAYGQNTHSALLVWIDGEPHLLDPGYLIVDPVPIFESGSREVFTSFNKLGLLAHDDGLRIDLATIHQKASKYRLTYKTSPVDDSQFLKAWDESFGWDMMRYPLLSRTDESGQIYMRGEHFQVRDHDTIQREQVSYDEIVQRIAMTFGIDSVVTGRALAILKSAGEFGGRASSC